MSMLTMPTAAPGRPAATASSGASPSAGAAAGFGETLTGAVKSLEADAASGAASDASSGTARSAGGTEAPVTGLGSGGVADALTTSFASGDALGLPAGASTSVDGVDVSTDEAADAGGEAATGEAATGEGAADQAATMPAAGSESAPAAAAVSARAALAAATGQRDAGADPAAMSLDAEGETAIPGLKNDAGAGLGGAAAESAGHAGLAGAGSAAASAAASSAVASGAPTVAAAPSAKTSTPPAAAGAVSAATAGTPFAEAAAPTALVAPAAAAVSPTAPAVAASADALPTIAPLGQTQLTPTVAAQPAAPAAAAPAPVPQDFSAQLAKPIALLRGAASGEHVITVNVTPENLGPVTVRAHIAADGMRIELISPSEAGREALKAILGDLRRDLAGLGVTTGPLTAAGGSQQGQGQPGQAAAQSTLDLAQGQAGQNGSATPGTPDRKPAIAATELGESRDIRNLDGTARTGIDVLA